MGHYYLENLNEYLDIYNIKNQNVVTVKLKN